MPPTRDQKGPPRKGTLGRALVAKKKADSRPARGSGGDRDSGVQTAASRPKPPNKLVGASGKGTARTGVTTTARLPVQTHNIFGGKDGPSRVQQADGTVKVKLQTKAERQAHQASVIAPAVKILDQTTRPIHGVAGAADALVKGKSLSQAHHALTRGLQNKDKKLFSDVLKSAGAPGIVQSVGGFGLDIALDPTTYLTGGVSTVGRNAAVKQGERIAAKAVRKGMSAERAETLGKLATSRALKASGGARGATVRFAGKELPGVTRVTAASGKVVKRAAAKAPRPVQRAGAVVKEQVREVRPTLAPAGTDKVQFAEARAVARNARAATNAGAATADREARGLAARIAKLEKDHGTGVSAQIIDAIERGNIGSLPAGVRKQAVEIRSHYRYLKKIRTRAGVREGTIENYFPHAREDALLARMGVVEDPAVSVSNSAAKRTGPSPEGSATRSDRRPLKEASAARVERGESPFSTDIPLVTSNYASSTARTVAENTAFKELADLGRPYKFPAKGETAPLLRSGEAVYHLGYAGKNTRYGLRPVKDGDPRIKGGRYVVLDEKTVETVQKRLAPTQATTQAGRAFDKATGGFKRVATFTPGFHIRNAIGDTQMAYLSQPGHTLPRNMVQAQKANRVNVRLEKAQEKQLGALVPDSGKTIKVAGKRMSVEKFAEMARKYGVVNSGQISRELADLSSAATGARRVAGKAGRAARKVSAPAEKAMRGRENVIRLATFKHGLDKGMTPREAADLSLKVHIDYGDLTEFERKALRRALPFYTFSARAIPLHAEKLVTHPGKFAAYQKLREEGAKAVGLENGYETGESEFQQRNAPIPISIGGKVNLLSAGLPIASSLNELPTTANPLKYASELTDFALGQANPLIKNPLELQQNHSAFFREVIRNPDRPLVSAPTGVTKLPKNVRDAMGITTIIDKKTGKPIPAWDATSNYLLKMIPGPVALGLSLLTPGPNKRGQSTAAKVIGGLGLKIDEYDPAKTAINNAYEKADELSSRIGKLRQEGKDRSADGHYTVRYQRLLEQRRQVIAARDALVEGTGAAPVKPKAASGGGSGWGDSGGGTTSGGGSSSGGSTGWGDGGGSSSSAGGWGD